VKICQTLLLHSLGSVQQGCVRKMMKSNITSKQIIPPLTFLKKTLHVRETEVAKLLRKLMEIEVGVDQERIIIIDHRGSCH
jgi:hypothetical protein